MRTPGSERLSLQSINDVQTVSSENGPGATHATESAVESTLARRAVQGNAYLPWLSIPAAEGSSYVPE